MTDPWQARKQKRAAKQMRDLRIAADAWNARQAWLRRVEEIAAEETAAHYAPELIAEIEHHLKEQRK